MARAIQVLGKCASSHRLHPSVGLFAFRIYWKLDEEFPRPLVVKYKTDIPFQSLKETFDNNDRGKQRLKLTQRW